MDLSAMRLEYQNAGLTVDDLGADPLEAFRGWLGTAVEAGVTEPNAMVLSTVGAEGQPEGRNVLLKGLVDSRFEFYTNYHSTKSKQLAKMPRASLLFSWLAMSRQVSVQGTVERVSAQASDEYWAQRPRLSQLGAIASHQSEPLTHRAELEQRFEETERKYEDGNVPRPDHWGGWALTPTVIEFWQGRANRLHDRIRFSRQPDGNWAAPTLHNP